MYLKCISIRNFKTIQNLNIDFSEELNVIFGPNEAGKSTFLEALTSVFFTNADSGSRDVGKFRPWGTEADPYVEVKFIAGGNEYKLEKEFLGSRRGRLSCSAIRLDSTNKDKINEELAKILPLGVISEDAHKRTFWIAQRELEDTIESLHGDADIRTALQSAIMKADGDIEAIKTLIDIKIKEIGKGSRHLALFPGPLEQSRQTMERFDKEVRELKAKFATLERDVVKHKELSARVAELERQIKDEESVLAAAEKYDQAKKNLDNANKNFDLLQEAVDTYQNSQTRIVDLRAKLPELDKELKEVDGTIRAVQAITEIQRITSKLHEEEGLLAAVNSLDVQIAGIQNELGVTKLVAKTDLDSTRNLQTAIAAKREALKTAQLSVEAQGLSDIQISIAEDQSTERSERVGKDETKTFRANQEVKVTVPGFIQLNITSGVKSAAELQRDLEGTEKSYSTFLSKYSVASFDELATQFETQQKLMAEIAGFENQKKGALRGRTTDAIERSIATLKARKQEKPSEMETYPLKPGETIESLQAKRDRIVEGRAKLNAEADQLELAAKKFVQTYVSIDAAQAKKKELAREAAKAGVLLEEIPKMEIPDDQVYLRKQQLGRNKIEYETSRKQLLILTGALQSSPVSSDQLSIKEAELAEAAASYQVNLLEYEAYTLLQETLGEAELEVSKHLTEPIQSIVTTVLPRLTNGRYAGVNLDESLKIESVQYKDQNVDPEDLSTGAKGQLALALRLALIEHLSGKERQTVVIDDALVNFDGARLIEAKTLLNEFSKKHQVIFLSCHDEMKVGEVIKLYA